MTKIEGVQVVLQVMLGYFIIQLGLPVMNLSDDLTDSLSNAAGLLLGKFGVKRCQREGRIKVSTKRLFILGMVTFWGD